MRQLVIRLGAVWCGLMVALLLAEGVLRVLDLAPSDGVGTVTEAQFAAIPGILAPGQDLVDKRDPRLPHHVTTNSLGYRGEEFPLAKPRGEFRVLFTGDSFAYGDFVDDGQTFPAQLEKNLNGVCGRVRVINAGLDNGTIVDETPMIERGLPTSPDLAVVLFSENDVSDMNRRSTWDHLADNRHAKSRFPLSIAYPVLRRTALWNFGLNFVATMRVRRNPVHIVMTAAADNDSVTTRLRESYRAALVRLRDTLATRGIPLVLTVYPSHHAVLSEAKRDQVNWITTTATAEGIPVVNLLPPLAASGLPMEQIYLLPFDGHPSPRGYGISASYLASRLSESHLVPNSCGAIASSAR